jgi:hypothetical protein
LKYDEKKAVVALNPITDICGGGWDSSRPDVLVFKSLITASYSTDVDPVPPVFINAGQRAQETTPGSPTATATP